VTAVKLFLWKRVKVNPEYTVKFSLSQHTKYLVRSKMTLASSWLWRARICEIMNTIYIMDIIVCLLLAYLVKVGIPCSSGAGGVGSIPANSNALSVPSFRRWRFEMKLSPPLIVILNHENNLPMNPGQGGLLE
jgi:hypothetical protein